MGSRLERGDYELFFKHLVERLGSRSGERWLDFATRTGRVARLAAPRRDGFRLPFVT